MSVADDVIGRYVGGYRIVRELGSGGFGTVYLAENDINGRRYAIKVLAQWAAADRGPLNLRERFIQEAKAGGALEHDNIVQVTDIAAFADGRPYLVMPYIEGDELDVYCARVGGQWGHPGRITAEMALPLLLQILSALRHTHERNIVHRDLKSNNIIIAPGKKSGSFPTAHVLDFGIAKVLDPQLRVMKGVTTQIVLGSLGYMSPEQARGMLVDHRTDIYAMGIVMYKMMTGNRPFVGNSEFDIIESQLYSKPAAPHKIVPEIPIGWSRVIMDCIEPKPDDRPDSAAEVGILLMRPFPNACEVAREVAEDFVVSLGALDPTVRAQSQMPGAGLVVDRAPTLPGMAATTPPLGPLSFAAIATPPPREPAPWVELEPSRDRQRTHAGSLKRSKVPQSQPLAYEVATATPSVWRPSTEHDQPIASASPSLWQPSASPHPSEPRAAATAPPRTLTAAQKLAIAVLAIAVAVGGSLVVITALGREGQRAVVVTDASVANVLPKAVIVDAAPAQGMGSARAAESVAAQVAVSPVDAAPPPPPRGQGRAHEQTKPEAPGHLVVRAKPWADVAIDGRDVGSTPVSLDLPPGRHTVRLTPPEGKPETRLVRITSGKETTLERAYEP